MATSSTICNFLSFILPTKPPPSQQPPPPQLNLPSSSTPFPSQTHKFSHNLVPLVSQDDPSSSSSSRDLSSVICPSLAYANTLFFRSAYNVQVVVGDNEPEEKLLNRFRREVFRAGVIQECKRRRYFENKQDEKKRRTRDAAKRNKKRRPFSRTFTQNKEDVPITKKEEDIDNWDLPEGGTPY
ncbi:small ribosomal subunit protein bS21c-like [Gastrolobium bilobum]|uniref:small ribosomal subunit protein bS21c-like n=1 Tax=Gastrolobium bilobum TaxID=150636 RepID=UPI002AB326C7|nr:small ribosomal subunit protein bS21c-like [Gastrolobium bilobum]